jgi:hypothetical protein
MSMQRWERRERKKQAERDRIPKSGMSVRLLEQILGRRAAAARAKEARVPASQPTRKSRQRH